MRSNFYKKEICLPSVLSKAPDAIAAIKGSEKYPEIEGAVKLYGTCFGIIVSSVFSGLPYEKGRCKRNFYAYHIHEGEKCSGNEGTAFSDTLNHYNPELCEHPYHKGDMPPLSGNNGYALSVFLTDRFTMDEIIGRTVIIHSGVDDFTSQPSGNAGEKIACGVIRKC